MDVYAKVTGQIIEQLERGVVPWRKHWSLGQARSLVSGRPYTGINRLLLTTNKFASPYWLTFNQTAKLGGHVRKGERSSMAVFFKIWEKESSDGVEKIPVLRNYQLFNLDQVELPAETIADQKPADIMTELTAPSVVDGYEKGPRIEVGARPAYQPKADTVICPAASTFGRRDDYYLALFHELIHSTGHKDRLDRGLKNTQLADGELCKEELVAEIGAAFLADTARIEHATEDQSRYIAGWLGLLRQDKRAIVFAAGQAEKAANWILGNR